MIYIATHKKFNAPTEIGYAPLNVGAALREDLGYLRDDTGENISSKNKSYCELTGLYWIWKNTADDYVGLVHYRRYFCHLFNRNCILSEDLARKKLEKYDIIVPIMGVFAQTVAQQYEYCGFRKDLDLCGSVIQKLYSEYYSDYENVLNGHNSYFGNMIIAKREIFDDYCKWLFDILFELEKHTDLAGYNDFQQRIYGFISERLLTVYIKHNNLRACEMRVAKTDDVVSFAKNIKLCIKWVIKYFLYNVSHAHISITRDQVGRKA